jgi:hypothetical protein
MHCKIFQPYNMKAVLPQIILVTLISFVAFSSCVTAKKFDAYVSAQYNDQVPPVIVKKKANNIQVKSPLVTNHAKVSNTTQNTKVLPLLLYWYFNHRFVCDLNNQIPVAGFAKAITAASAKSLDNDLTGRQLELTVEQAPASFSMIDKTNVIWLILYAVDWSKVYIEPDTKDLIVSYRLLQGDATIKAGKIIIKNNLHNQGLRMFQSWKSAVSEYVVAYDREVAAMTKEFAAKLSDELAQPTTATTQ